MTNMTISPMQLDHVTREEFGEFKDKFEDFREETNDNFINLDRKLKDFTINGIEKIETYIDKNVAILSGEIQQSKVEIINHINRVMKAK